jgi:SAM-dependent methyltransferase
MRGYQTCHRTFSFFVQMPPNLAHLAGSCFQICRLPLDALYARIVTKSYGTGVKHALKKLLSTPHFRFVQGNQHEYREYLARYGLAVGYGAEHSVDRFSTLLASDEGYLAPPFASHYIICERVKSILGEKIVIVDGVHRACQLLLQGVTSVPVAVMEKNQADRLAQFYRYLIDYKDDFLEWYTPLEIAGKVIHERTFPAFIERPEFLVNRERGRSKWEYIIKKNLPDLHGKSVCDIGCNCGLFSIYMAQCGARQVVGYDRSESVVQPTNTELPPQNVVEQAYFVRNLFSLSGAEGLENIEFISCNLNQLDFSTLHHDVFFSCCVLYHFGERFEEIIRAIHQKIPEILLQTNLGHKEPILARYASIEYHRTLLEKYGYTVSIDAPDNYDYPVICGQKHL